MLQLGRATPATMDVLRALLDTDGPTWGLRLVGETGRPAGSVYPILARLEEGGWVSSRWDDDVRRGPRRRLYELTDQGGASASALLAEREARAVSLPRSRRMTGAAGLA